MLKLHDLSRVYQTDDIETAALNKVNIEIAKGEFVAIMGPSGCGKSTLLNTIGMLDSPSSGHYYFNGEDVSGYSEMQLQQGLMVYLVPLEQQTQLVPAIFCEDYLLF